MRGPNINTRVLIRARGEAGNSERDVIIEAKVSHMTWAKELMKSLEAGNIKEQLS